MNCRRVDRLCEAYIDDRLPAGKRARLEAHLGDCSACQAKVAAARRLAAELRPALRQALGSPTLRPQVEAQIRQRVAQTGRQSTRVVAGRLVPALVRTAALVCLILLMSGLFNAMIQDVTTTPSPPLSPSAASPTLSATPTPRAAHTLTLPGPTVTPESKLDYTPVHLSTPSFPVPMTSPTAAPILIHTPESTRAPASSPASQPTSTSSPTSQFTPTPSSTSRFTPTPSSTSTPSPTLQPSSTPSPTLQPGSTPSPTLQPGSTPSPTLQPGSTPSPTLQPSSTPSPTPPSTFTPTPTPTNALTILVDPVDSPTNLLTQTVTGETAPEAWVGVWCESGQFGGKAGGDGLFAIQIGLAPGVTHYLEVAVYDGRDWTSTTVDRNGDPLEIVQTSEPATLTLLVDPVTSPTDQLTQTITGETEPGVQVEVSGEGDHRAWGVADANGLFAIQVWLAAGVTNHLEVWAYEGSPGNIGRSANTTVDRYGAPLEIVQMLQ